MAKGNHSNKVTAYWMERCHKAEVAEIEAVRERDKVKPVVEAAEDMAEKIRTFEDAYNTLNSNDYDPADYDVVMCVIVQAHRELRDSLERYDAIQQLEETVDNE